MIHPTDFVPSLRFFVASLFLAVFVQVSFAQKLNAREDKPIVERWVKSDLAAGGKDQWQVVRASDGHPVRRGKKSHRFELRAGECGSNPFWSDCKSGRARIEAVPRDNRSSRLPQFGETWWYGWSVYLPEDFPEISPARATLGQWKMPSKAGQVTAPPAETFIDSRTYFMRAGQARTTKQKDIFIARTNDMRGKWTDVVAEVKWSADTTGYMRIWANGQYMGEFAGRQMFGDNLDLPISFRFGIYLQEMYGKRPDDKPLIVYFDEVSRGKTREAVDVRLREAKSLRPVD